MTKQELIEQIEKLIYNLESNQSEPIKISVDIDSIGDKWQAISDKLIEADNDLDMVLSELQEARDLAEELAEYEYTTTFAKMASHIANKILCNQIVEIDEDFNEVMPDMQSIDGQPIGEVMQYYLTDCSSDDVDYLCKNYDRVYFSYSNKLDLWVLMVDHWGSSWDIVEIGTHNEYDKIER